MYKIVLLDLDNTILDFSQAEAYAFLVTLNEYGIEYNVALFAKYLQLNEYYWQQSELGKMSVEEVCVKRFVDLLAIQYPQIDYVKLNEDYLQHLGDKVFFIEHSLDMLVYLRSKGYKLYIVSNGVVSVQEKRMNICNLLDYVDGSVYSGEIGYHKPTPQFFECALKKFGLENINKPEIVLIGDSLTSDIQGANNFGIDCIWYNAKHKPNNKGVRVTYEIDNLFDVINIL